MDGDCHLPYAENQRAAAKMYYACAKEHAHLFDLVRLCETQGMFCMNLADNLARAGKERRVDAANAPPAVRGFARTGDLVGNKHLHTEGKDDAEDIGPPQLRLSGDL
jgi:hypothetical protein